MNRLETRSEATYTKKALIIAISDYDKLDAFSFCKNDGEAMFNLLFSLGYQVRSNQDLIGYVTWDKMRDGIINFLTIIL